MSELHSQFCSLEVDSIVVAEGNNARQQFDEQLLVDLGESLVEHSQLHPIIVNRKDGVNYLVCGERRLRAARQSEQEFIEAKVYEDLDPKVAHAMTMAENRDRQPLNCIERARSYQRAVDLGFDEKQIAQMEHYSLSTIQRIRKLLDLPVDVQQMMIREQFPLPIHQALMLLNLKDKNAIIQMARRIAPVVGPVASEKQAALWIEEVLEKKRGPKLKLKKQNKPDEPTEPPERYKRPVPDMPEKSTANESTDSLDAIDKAMEQPNKKQHSSVDETAIPGILKIEGMLITDSNGDINIKNATGTVILNGHTKKIKFGQLCLTLLGLNVREMDEWAELEQFVVDAQQQ